MLKKSIRIIFLFWCALVFSQQPEKIPHGDSLQYYLTEIRNRAFDDSPKALRLLKKAKIIAKKSSNPKDWGNVALSYGLVYYVRGDYEESLHYYLQAHETFREIGDDLGMARALSGHGLILQGIDRNVEAISIFEEAISRYKKAGKNSAFSHVYVNIAISEIEMGDLEDAKGHLQKALSLVAENGQIGDRHLAWNKLGEINFLEGNVEEAIEYYNLVLKDSNVPNGWEKSFSHAGLAQVYLKQEKYSLAEEHALHAMEYAQKAASTWDLERNTNILFKIYDNSGEPEKALKYLKLNQKYRDILYNEKRLREINFSQLKSKEEENFRLTAEKELTERKLYLNKLFLFLVIALSLFLILTVFLLRKNTKNKERYNAELVKKNQTILKKNKLISQQNQKLRKINKSKDNLFSILSHDLRGPIGSIKQLLELMQAGSFSFEEKEMLFDEMRRQVTGTSEMLQNLLIWAKSQQEVTQTKPEKIYLPELVTKILEVYSFAAKIKNIELIHAIPNSLSSVEVDKDQLKIVIHNLISNAIKFTVEGHNIHVKYAETGNRVNLRVIDGGNGITKEKINEILSMDDRMFSEVGTNRETGTGLGLMLVKRYLKANKATLDIKNNPSDGSEFIVSFLKFPN